MLEVNHVSTESACLRAVRLFARIIKVEGIGVKFYFFCGRDVIKQFLVKK